MKKSDYEYRIRKEHFSGKKFVCWIEYKTTRKRFFLWGDEIEVWCEYKEPMLDALDVEVFDTVRFDTVLQAKNYVKKLKSGELDSEIIST
ncbi:hypothetical protein [Vibrio phage phiKT1024]|nr:hypothetical protein [Vibrio phage phiKT1024]